MSDQTKPLRLLVVVPAYNEESIVESTLTELIEAVPPIGWSRDIVLIDDGSSDETAKLARKMKVTVISLPFNCGVGVALRTGFKWAKLNDYDAVVQVDADGQHPIDQMASLLDPIRLNDADVVVGSRFLQNEWKTSFSRKIAMKLMAKLVTFGTAAELTDATSGFRSAGKNAIEVFSRSYPGEYLGDTVESLVLAHHEKLKITEVPVAMKVRQGGTPSHLTIRSGLHVLRAFTMVLLAVSRNEKVKK